MVDRKVCMGLVNLEKTFDHVQKGKGMMKREVFAITKMYKYIKTFFKIDAKQSKECFVKVGVH